MASTWRQRLEAGGTLIVDGGTGSELRRRGVPLHAAAWSALAALTHYDVLRAVHADYVAAGADVIIVNTFAATRFVLDAAGAAHELGAIVRRSVAAAREARDAAGRDVAIAGSVSCLPPRFDVRAYPRAAAEHAAYVELAELLAAAGVDLIALEMLQDAEHGARACTAVRGTGLPFWLGVSCRVAAPRRREASGARGSLAAPAAAPAPAPAAAPAPAPAPPHAPTLVAYDFPERPLASFLPALLEHGPSVVNVMHSPADAVAAALAALRDATGAWLGAYPELDSAAEPVLAAAGSAAESVLAAADSATDRASAGPAPARAHALGDLAIPWRAAGARLLGGCCGTTPGDIAALAASIRGRSGHTACR